jgi:hypothetical protein
MKITWINPAPIVVAKGGKTSDRVCVRLRGILPSEELARRGHDLEQVFFQDLPTRLREPRFLTRDLFVFGNALADFSPFPSSGGTKTLSQMSITPWRRFLMLTAISWPASDGH